VGGGEGGWTKGRKGRGLGGEAGGGSGEERREGGRRRAGRDFQSIGVAQFRKGEKKLRGKARETRTDGGQLVEKLCSRVAGGFVLTRFPIQPCVPRGGEGGSSTKQNPAVLVPDGNAGYPVGWEKNTTHGRARGPGKVRRKE